MQDARGPLFLLVLPLANKARSVEQIILAARFIFNVHGTRTIPSAEENVTPLLGFSHSVVFPVLAGLVTRRAASCPIKMHRTTQPSSATRTADRPALTPLIFMPLFGKDSLKLWLSCFTDEQFETRIKGGRGGAVQCIRFIIVQNVQYTLVLSRTFWTSEVRRLRLSKVYLEVLFSFRGALRFVKHFDAIALRFACTRYYLRLVRIQRLEVRICLLEVLDPICNRGLLGIATRGLITPCPRFAGRR